MKKYLTPALAVIAVIAIVLCIVFAGQRGVKQEDYDALNAKLTDAEAAAKTAADAAAKEKDEAVAAVQATADEAVAAKTELEGQVKDLTAKLTDAEAAAKTAAEAAAKEKDEAVAAVQATADEAVAAKTELEGQVEDLTAKLTDAEAAAKTAAEAAAKEKDDAVAAVQATVDDTVKTKTELEGQVKDLTAKLAETEAAAAAAAEAAIKEKEEAVAAAQAAAQNDTKTKIDEAVKTVQDKADEAKAAFEGQIADLNKQLEDAKEAATKDADAAAKALADAADAAKTELEGKVTELTEKLTAAEAAKDEAVAAAKKEAEEAVAAAKTELEAAKAALETKVADLEKQVADAAAAAKAAVQPEEKPAEPAAEENGVMDHAAYAAAELDTAVCVETYVQATQSWWDNKITVYAQSEDGAYFIYNMACTEEDAAKLVPGAKIRVKGFKSEWAGETEIVDATFELIDGEAFIAEAEDITSVLGTDDLINHQNEKVLFKGLTVTAQDDGEPFGRKNPAQPDDLYVRFTNADGQVFNFCIEYYLTNENTDVYKAVEGLQIGDVVDVEGYLYWYEGPNTHIIAVTKAE